MRRLGAKTDSGARNRVKGFSARSAREISGHMAGELFHFSELCGSYRLSDQSMNQ
jgi:hypothetical protein